MSDVQCPATVLVMRHGDARYPTKGLLTDDPGVLSELGEQQARAAGAALRDDPGVRIAAVYSSTLHRAVQTAELAASVLGVPHRALDGLQELGVGRMAGTAFRDPQVQSVFQAWADGELDLGFPGAETAREGLTRCREALESIADLHRGEGVLVVSHGALMAISLPRLPSPVRQDLLARRFIPNAAPARLRTDADGWVVDDWPGTANPDDV